MKRREDGAVREVMKALLRSDLRFIKEWWQIWRDDYMGA